MVWLKVYVCHLLSGVGHASCPWYWRGDSLVHCVTLIKGAMGAKFRRELSKDQQMLEEFKGLCGHEAKKQVQTGLGIREAEASPEEAGGHEGAEPCQH